MTMRGCLDMWTLAAFANGTLVEAEAASVEEHLEHCVRCAKALAKLPVNDALVEQVRDLEHQRQDAGPALSELNEVQQRVSTTIFGRRPTV